MALLEVRGLRVRRRGALVLDSVSLSVGRGEIVGLIGPNGAGKTTLFDAVGGLVEVEGGSVTLDGREIGASSADRRARMGIGRTFQTPRLAPSMSVGESLLGGCQARLRTGIVADSLRLPWSTREERLARAEVERIARLVGVEEILGEPVAGQPLGVLRLVEIARALCGLPRVLLLDEAVSGMAREAASGLCSLIRRIGRATGAGILVVEHDVEFVLELCDAVYVLDAGRLIARGSPQRVRDDPAVIAAYLGEETPARSEEAGVAAVG
jgi:branched-chain amino acid transport system ATP-binding protein